MPMIYRYKTPAVSEAKKKELLASAKKNISRAIQTIETEFCFYIDASDSFDDHESELLGWLFEALGPLAVLAARALITVADAVLAAARSKGGLAVRAVPAGISVAGAVLAAFPLGVRLPAQLRYHAQAYHGQTAAPLRDAAKVGVGDNALIFVTSSQGGFVYGTYFTRNELEPLRGERVFARALAPLAEEAIRRVPRREVWRLRLDLEPLPGPNAYPDAWKVLAVDWKRLDVAPR